MKRINLTRIAFGSADGIARARGAATARVGALLALLLGVVASTASTAAAQVLHFRQYTAADGLPQAQVLAMHQDREGYLWFGSYGGLTRFDGGEFHTFTTEDGLSSNSVFDIVEDSSGRLYIATDRGLCIKYRSKFTCRRQADGLVSDVTRNVSLDRVGGIWVGTFRGLSQIVGDSVRNFTSADGLPTDRVLRVVADSGGRVWVATPAGLVRFDGRRMVSDPADPLSTAAVQFIAPAGSGLLIAAEGRLYLRHGDVTTEVAAGKIPAGTAFTNGTMAADGSIWAGSRTGALHIHNGVVDRITKSTGLLRDMVNKVITDREGNVWFGTDKGLSKHVPGPFRTYTTENGLPDSFVRTIALNDSGHMWVGTRSGVAVRDSGGFTQLQLPEAVRNSRVYALARAPWGGMLIGTNHGLVWYKDGKSKLYGKAEGIPGEVVFSLVDDAHDGVVIGTERGLARMQNGRISLLGPPGFSEGGVISLFRDSRGRIWLGRVTGGVGVWEGDSIHVIGPDNGGSAQTVWDMRESADGTMWVGTNGDGVLRIKGDSVRRMTIRDGLASNFIWQVLADSRGDTWLFGNLGLDRISGGKLIHYGRGDGLAELEGTATAAFEDGEGDLWFGTGDGVVRYTAGMDIEPALAPPVSIEQATLDGNPILSDTLAKDRRLARGAIRFRFSSPIFRDETAVRFRYRLVGSSNDWSAPVSERSITFAGLSPASYRFEVVAVNGPLQSETPAVFAFVVAPAMWQSWWFQLLVVVSLAGGASIIPVLRGRALERERKRLEQLVATHTRELADKNLRLERSNGDLEYFAFIASHDLQEPLRKIQAFSDRVTTRYAERLDDQGRDYLGRMSSAAARMQLLIDALLGLSRVSSKKLTSEPVELKSVVTDVLGDLEIRLQSTGGMVEVGQLPNTEGDVVQLRQLFQNLISNALKFSRSGEAPRVRVSAVLSEADRTMEIRVQDNGVGFESKDAVRIFQPFQRLHGRAQYEGTGIGLTICQKIVERHGGTIRAESEPGVGTTFFISLPLHAPTGIRHAA
ncbi:MAG: two-component regulator propeller domain-containing protein [Gemmatimonas sp.]